MSSGRYPDANGVQGYEAHVTNDHRDIEKRMHLYMGKSPRIMQFEEHAVRKAKMPSPVSYSYQSENWKGLK